MESNRIISLYIVLLRRCLVIIISFFLAGKRVSLALQRHVSNSQFKQSVLSYFMVVYYLFMVVCFVFRIDVSIYQFLRCGFSAIL